MDGDHFLTNSLQDARILRILASAIRAVDPYQAVQKYLPQIDGRVFGLGIGKAAIPMMDALADRFSLADGLAVTKFAPERKSYTVLEGGHPVPDVRSQEAGTRALEFVSALHAEDTLVCLISGGGSALVTAPRVPLPALQALTSMLLASGAPIDDINTLRRHLDRVKGGGLARATPARIVSLILSDVIGNPLETIASGPTAPDPTSKGDALRVLDRYDLLPDVSLTVLQSLLASSETPKQGDPTLARVQNIIVGDNRLAARAALEQAVEEALQAEILTNELQGEAREVGRELAHRLRVECQTRKRPFCLIAGGETTVTIRGNGKGGRNQELALAAVEGLSGLQDVMLVALATDGDDGPTDAAGAVATGESARRAESLGLDAAEYLSHNDAYPFFEKLGDLLKTAPTGTNVNDLIFLCAL